MGALKSRYIWGAEILKTEREKQKKGKKSECVWNKVKEWQRERIEPPCHLRLYIRNINSVMRMTCWMTRGLMSVKTLKGVKKKKEKEKKGGEIYQSECG